MSNKLEIDEVFELPVFVSDGFVESKNFRYLNVIDDFDWPKTERILGATVAAINNHKRLTEENKRLREALKDILYITDDSTGVCGYHLNGDIADWDEFVEIRNANQLLSELDGE